MWLNGQPGYEGDSVDPTAEDSDPVGACVAMGDAPGLSPTYTLWMVQALAQALEVFVPFHTYQTNPTTNECYFGIILSEKQGGQEVAGGCWGKYGKAKHLDAGTGQTKLTCPPGT